jgi:hypothetical protein|tara:strand:- start:143 stop:574 length:432 start_codon:yes stop_codon:yes gene_type:complete
MKNKGLFDHIKQITNVQNPMYWDTLTESDKKTWSNYMIHRFISMKSDWIEVANEIQRYWELKPKTIYQFYTNILPRGRTFLRYVKSKKKSKVEKWAMEHLKDYFECSSREVEENLELLTKEQVVYIIMKYGVDDKQLKKIYRR